MLHRQRQELTRVEGLLGALATVRGAPITPTCADAILSGDMGSSTGRRTSSDCGGAGSDSCISSDDSSGGHGSTPDVSSKATQMADSTSCRHLQLGNIAEDADREALEQLLGWFGPLDSLHIVPTKNLAVAVYQAPQHAAAAKAALEGQTLPCVTGDLAFLVDQAPAQQQQHNQMQEFNIATEASESVFGNGDITALLSSFQALGLPLPNDSQADGSAYYAVSAAGGSLASAASDNDCKGLRNPAQSSSAAASESQPSRHLFLAYVIQNIDQHLLALTFAPYGVVESVRVFPSMHYAFVNYLDIQSAVAAKAALEGKIIPSISGSRPLQMRYKHRTATAPQIPLLARQNMQRQTRPQSQQGVSSALPLTGPAIGGINYGSATSCNSGCGSSSARDDWEGAVPASMAEGKPGRRLWVGNIPSGQVGQHEVAELFGPFGPLDSVRVFPDRNFAFVNYVWPQHAAAARSALNDQMVPSWTSNRTLLVRYPRDREPRIGRDPVVNGAVPIVCTPDTGFASDPAARLHNGHALGGRALPSMDNNAAEWAKAVSVPGLGGTLAGTPAFGAAGLPNTSLQQLGASQRTLAPSGAGQLPSYAASSIATSGRDMPSVPASNVLKYLMAMGGSSNSMGDVSMAHGHGLQASALGLQQQAHQPARSRQAAVLGLQTPSSTQDLWSQPRPNAGLGCAHSAAPPEASAAMLQLLHSQMQAAASRATGGAAALSGSVRPLAGASNAQSVFAAPAQDSITGMYQAVPGASGPSMGAMIGAPQQQGTSSLGVQAGLAQLLMQLLSA